MLLHKLMTMMTAMVTRPLSFSISVFVFGVKTAMLVVNTWIELAVAAINVHINVFRKLMIWIIALLLLPIRVLTALQKERQLEQQICEVQIEVDNLMWDMKELEDKFYASVNERRLLELMLTEVEDESDKAIVKIELLENELQHLKRENRRQKEILAKGNGSGKDHEKIIKQPEHNDYDISCDIQSWKSAYKNTIVFEEQIMHKEAGESVAKCKEESLSFFQAGSKGNATIYSRTYNTSPSDLEARQILKRRREAALLQSLFSAVLSLLVGLIIWEAEDKCLPLVGALFTVVGMSLKSVVEFFSTIENKPASDAVALLSFNWFILGTITCPTLPIIARLLAPLMLSCFGKMMKWLGS